MFFINTRRAKFVDPRVRKAVASLKSTIQYTDHVLEAAPEMANGVDMVTFAGPSFDALYVGPWTLDMDDMLADIRRELGLPEAEAGD